jgi:hypothetical protein
MPRTWGDRSSALAPVPRGRPPVAREVIVGPSTEKQPSRGLQALVDHGPMTSSKYGRCQPPYWNPSSVSPGACITPSRERNSLTITFLIAVPPRSLPQRSSPGRAPEGPPGRPRDPIRDAEVMPCGSTVHDPSRIHTGIVRPPGHCPSPICSPPTPPSDGREPPPRRARGVRVRWAFGPRSRPGAEIAPRVRSTRGAAGTVRTRQSRTHPRQKPVA